MPGMRPLSTSARACLGLVCVVAACLLLPKLSSEPFPLDLHIYMVGGSAALHDHPVYGSAVQVEGFGFTYPPFAAILFALPSALGAQLQLVVLTGFSLLGLAALTGYSVANGQDKGGQATRTWVLVAVLPALVLCEPVRITLWNGQINLVLAGIIAWDLLDDRHERWRGVGVGIATGIKLTPGVFVLYFVATRQWRAAAVSAVSFAGTAVSGLIVLPSDSLRFWTSKVFGNAAIGDTARPGNQSVFATAHRALGPGGLATACGLLAGALVLTVGLWSAAQLERRGQRTMVLAVLGTVSCLVSPVAWTHHWVWCIPVVLALLGRAAGRGVIAHVPVALLLALFVIGCNKEPISELYRWTLGRIVFANGYVLAGLLLLAWITVVELRRRGVDPAAESMRPARATSPTGNDLPPTPLHRFARPRRLSRE